MHKSVENSELFKGVSLETIEELLKTVKWSHGKYDIDEIMFYAGKKLTEIHMIVGGSVRAEMFGESGKIIKIHDIKSGELVAPAFMFGENQFYPTNISANEKVETIYFAKQEFIKLLQYNGKVLANYLNIVSSKAQFLSQKLNFLSFKTIKEKFMFYISSISSKSGSNVLRLPMSQERLAELFGVTRPALGRAIRELNNEKVILAEGRNITLLRLG